MRSLKITISEEASKKLVKITSENIGRRLVVVFDNKILTAPTINAAVGNRTLTFSNSYGGNAVFWENSLWLQDLIRSSNRSAGRSVLSYAIIASAISISTIIFVFLPRMKRTRKSGTD